MWDHWCGQIGIGPKNDGYTALKFAYYCAATQIYNVIIESMHRDPTMTSTAMLSEALRQDIEAYFADKGQDFPTIN